MRVLVAEDDQTVREVTTEMLSAAGFDAKAAGTGTEAWELLQAEPMDLLVTDVVMPGMNGIELIHNAHQKYPELEAIVMSGTGTESTRNKLKQLGVFGFIEKPLKAQDFIAMANEAAQSDRVSRLNYTEKGPSVSFQKENVLVVDDDPTSLEVMSEVLKRVGFRVDAASDGAEAFEMALLNDYSLVVSDINMPRMAGGDTVRALRKIDPHTHIILVSGEALQAEIDAAMAEGANHFMPKPLDIGKLTELVKGINFSAIHAGKEEMERKKRRDAFKRYPKRKRIWKFFRLHSVGKKITEGVVYVLIAAALGAGVVFFEASTKQTPQDEVLMDKLDKLIKAVEMDWGR